MTEARIVAVTGAACAASLAIAIAVGIVPAIALQMIVLVLARVMASGVDPDTQRMHTQRSVP